jgi:hypothetical protein
LSSSAATELNAQPSLFFVRSIVLLAILLLLLTPRRTGNAIAAVLAAIALAIQPMLGHAGALGGSIGTTLITSEVLHLLAAGAWLGGLLPLYVTIRTLPHHAAAKRASSPRPPSSLLQQLRMARNYSRRTAPAAMARKDVATASLPSRFPFSQPI